MRFAFCPAALLELANPRFPNSNNSSLSAGASGSLLIGATGEGKSGTALAGCEEDSGFAAAADGPGGGSFTAPMPGGGGKMPLPPALGFGLPVLLRCVNEIDR